MEKSVYDSWTSGRFLKAHTYFGAHPYQTNNVDYCCFRVYAPSAKMVYVKGDFNGWYENIAMQRNTEGIWTVEIKNVPPGSEYKYCIETSEGHWLEKTDPFATLTRQHPSFNSVVEKTEHRWNDDDWVEKRKIFDVEKSPLLIYEVHLGSWQKTPENEFLSYRDIAMRLIPYVKECGFTHIELLPISEHPFLGSWGYQQTGLFATTSRYGLSDDLRFLIDYAHQNDIGVIFDFVPVHFCKDMHGLQKFDGTNLYEYNDWKRENEGWGTLNFDLGKGDVQSFLLSSLDYWASSFHIDGFRFDAVSHLIYRGGLKENGENSEGITFVKHMNGLLDFHYPDILRIAEDSSDYQGVTKKTEENGLGFHLKWDLGFANDHFQFMATPYDARKYQSGKITFARAYHQSEHFLLPYSHDEVVHGKKSLLYKQQGNRDEQFAALAVELAFWIFHPGKKLLFMGQEFAQEKEWNEAYSLDWHELQQKEHEYFFDANKRLFHLYCQTKALYKYDYQLDGNFEWIAIDEENSVFAILRRADEEVVVGVFNFNLMRHYNYALQLPPGTYQNVFTNEDFTTDSAGYYGMNIERLSYQMFKLKGRQ